MNRIGFLKRMIGVVGFGMLPLNVLLTKRKVYLLQCFVAGFRHYKGMEFLPEMEENDFIELRREYNNQHDEFAIALYWQQEKIGYVPAEHNNTIARLLDAEALPLLAIITHLNKAVKPWESAAIAIYFLQEDKNDFPQHAGYLTQLNPPEYTSSGRVRKEKEDLMSELYNTPNRIINLSLIPNVDAKKYYDRTFPKKVLLNGEEHRLADNDGIYHFLYNNFPVKWVKADDGKEYIQFEYRNT